MNDKPPTLTPRDIAIDVDRADITDRVVPRRHVGAHAPDTDPITIAVDTSTPPRLRVVPKTDEERAALGLAPTRRARVWARIRRAARWLWTGAGS